jgi:hypothetical protein
MKTIKLIFIVFSAKVLSLNDKITPDTTDVSKKKNNTIVDKTKQTISRFLFLYVIACL